jgi:DNA-binding NarL/FixJ family response regulator
VAVAAFVVHVSHPEPIVHAECQVAVELSGLPATTRQVEEGPNAQQAVEPPDVLVVGPGMRAVQSGKLIRPNKKAKTAPRAIALLALADLATLAPLVRAGFRGFVLDDRVARDIVPAIQAVGSGGAYLSADLLRAIVDPAARAGADPASQGITPREQEILAMIALGLSNKDAARRLDLSVRTVETHRLNIRKKTGARDRRDLIRVAQRLGLFGSGFDDLYDIAEASPAPGFHEE